MSKPEFQSKAEEFEHDFIELFTAISVFCNKHELPVPMLLLDPLWRMPIRAMPLNGHTEVTLAMERRFMGIPFDFGRIRSGKIFD